MKLQSKETGAIFGFDENMAGTGAYDVILEDGDEQQEFEKAAPKRRRRRKPKTMVVTEPEPDIEQMALELSDEIDALEPPE